MSVSTARDNAPASWRFLSVFLAAICVAPTAILLGRGSLTNPASACLLTKFISLSMSVSGGNIIEDLLQPDILPLLQHLTADPQLSVEIETNGSQPLAAVLALPLRPILTVDYKLPGSGMENHMQPQELTQLDKRDVVKFVCGSLDDLQRAAEIIRQLRLISSTNVYLSPVWGQIAPADMVEFMKQNALNGVNLQLQMHKFIWPPEARGV